jgi:hypothetical protein
MGEIGWRRHPVPDDAHRVEAIEDGEVVVGTITRDDKRHEWVAEADGQSRVCPSFGGAARFIETIREPETVVAVLRAPPAADPPERA